MSAGTGGRRGFWPVRDLPTVLWVAAVVVVALLHPVVPAPRWLMIHLLLLGAVTHAVLVWSTYFTEAVLHVPADPDGRARQSRRLVLLNLGVLGVVIGVPAGVWPLTAAAALAVACAVGWHGFALLGRLRTALPARFGGTVRYYVAAACLLPVGAAIGATVAHGVGDPWNDRLVVAHVVVNVLGWMGLTVIGTLVTLWPTMLRTRVADGAERAAGRALPVLVAGVLVAAGGAAGGSRPLVVLGVLTYLAGIGRTAPAFVSAARRKPPADFSTWSVLAGLTWLLTCLVELVVALVAAGSWPEVGSALDRVAVFLAAGFGAQVLLGALCYLVPVALGGGPTPVRVASAALGRGGALRVAMTNGGLAVFALPVPSLVRVLASALALGALAAFLPLVFVALRASRRAKALPVSDRPPRAESLLTRPPGQVTGLAATGLAAVVVAVAVGVALDPAALAHTGTTTSAAAGVRPTGHRTTVVVAAKDMRFSPSTIKVAAGDRLVIDVRNTDDSDVHDLVLDSGADSGRLAPGEAKRVDVGVVGRDVEGWCSVVGHRQMGMVLHIEVTGVATPRRSTPAPMAGMSGGPGTTAPDFMADPGKGFVAHDPLLPALEPGRVHRRTFTVEEVDREVAPGTTAHLWTYNGSAPGPLLHGRVGDTFVIRLVNDGTIGHSIDFHAGTLAPDRPMRTLPPGKSLVYRFTATKAGIWMYHCSSMPMSAHIANGLFGAVVIDPPGLPPVDRSYVLVQSELYLGGDGGPVDMGKLGAEEPDAVVFNGYANQYDHRPLRARVGERIRVWVLDAGPDRPTSFHVVGGQFDTVWSEGAYLLRPGQGAAQSLGLMPAQGGFVELSFPEAGHYPFVSHVMIDAERGAHGLFSVR